MLHHTITTCVALFALAAQPLHPSPVQEPKKYVVVINEKNAASLSGEKAKATVKKLFLKSLTRWPDGTESKPYARKGSSESQAAFVKAVLGMNDAELARHWLKIKNMNGSTPPKSVSSDRMLLKYVARHKGAFGVVSADAASKAKGVKVLLEF